MSGEAAEPDAPWLCPDCEALIAEAIQWRDWQSLNQGVYCDKHDPSSEVTP